MFAEGCACGQRQGCGRAVSERLEPKRCRPRWFEGDCTLVRRRTRGPPSSLLRIALCLVMCRLRVVSADTCGGVCHKAVAGGGKIDGYAPACQASCEADCRDRLCFEDKDIRGMDNYGSPCATGGKICCCAQARGGDIDGLRTNVRVYTTRDCSGDFSEAYEIASMDFFGGRCVPITGSDPTTYWAQTAVPNLVNKATSEIIDSSCVQRGTDSDGGSTVFMNGDCNLGSGPKAHSKRWYWKGYQLKTVAEDSCLTANRSYLVMAPCDGRPGQSWVNDSGRIQQFVNTSNGIMPTSLTKYCLQGEISQPVTLGRCRPFEDPQKWYFNGKSWLGPRSLNIDCLSDGTNRILVFLERECEGALVSTIDVSNSDAAALAMGACVPTKSGKSMKFDSTEGVLFPDCRPDVMTEVAGSSRSSTTLLVALSLGLTMALRSNNS
eukprot:TRINITY_DN46144_c0_g1_i1.p1 TRINITY_DN46144_c0_g1~~TRINITY_DN46144_c0_g1_i1.p1  ORF type:complete len:436 (-),score=59.52 TRINITY_DN46144_c0_g1_i1:233-1540(-)